MSLWARSDLASVSVSEAAHGGCGRVHARPAPGGVPDPVWKLDCARCEVHLRTDPNWSSTLSELPETPDEVKSREDFEKRGMLDRDNVLAVAMAKFAGIELPETMLRPLSGLASPVRAVKGTIVCADGHENEPGMKFCGQCGTSLRVPVKRTCPDGHEVAARMRFCGECGKAADGAPAAIGAAPAPVPGTAPAVAAVRRPSAGAPGKRLKDRGSTPVKATSQAASAA